MKLIIHLVIWYYQNTIHKIHVARGMRAAIKGLDPRNPQPPAWRVDAYFQDRIRKETVGDEDTESSQPTCLPAALYWHELERMRKDLWFRLWIHDLSKYTWKEARWFVKAASKLNKLTYDSPEYKAAMDFIRPGIQAHYEANRHHPEWHEDGIHGMCLIDEIEMICDWAAATRKHDDGNILVSIKKNAKRFGYEEDAGRIGFYQKLARIGFTAREWSGIVDADFKYEIAQAHETMNSSTKA